MTIVGLTRGDVAFAQSGWGGVTLWSKWPDTGGATDPKTLGHWAPETPIDLPSVFTGGVKTNFAVHSALVYGASAPEGQKAKLVLFRDHTLVYGLETSGLEWPVNTVNWNFQQPPEFVPDGDPTFVGHELFCAGYVQLPDGRLLISGNNFFHYYENYTPYKFGKASILDPSIVPTRPTAAENFWTETDSLPLLSGTSDPFNCANAALTTARYYPTLTALEDGRVLITAGDFWSDCDIDSTIGEGELESQLHWAIYDDASAHGSRWEVSKHSGNPGGFTNPWHQVAASLPSPAHSDSTMFSYPHFKVLPFGLFYYGNDYPSPVVPPSPPHPDINKSYLWTPSTPWGPTNSWQTGASTAIPDQRLKNRVSSNCIVLSLDATKDEVSVLLVGGGMNGQPNVGVHGSEIITYVRNSSGIVSSNGSWRQVGDAMNSSKGRRDANSVLLPTGQVLTIGGENNRDNHAENPVPCAECPTCNCSNCGDCEECDLCQDTHGPNGNQNADCEIFTPTPGSNPLTGTWEMVAGLGTYAGGSKQVIRGHHSIAILLPDGRVFSSGHENQVTSAVGYDYQIYYPPYLFDSNNDFAARDTIETAPLTVRYGLPFEIDVKNNRAPDIDEVCIMAPCAPTHANDFNQRRVVLSKAVVPGDNTKLVVGAVKDSSYAPPGYYMLIVLADGVPSEAKWVKVERQVNSDYTIAPGQTKYWGGDIWMDRDFEVQDKATLRILPGTRVHVKANTDRNNLPGGTAGKTEIVHRGVTEAVAPTLADSISFTTYDGTGAAGEWVGNRFILEGCERTGYGYMGAKQAPSKFENVHIAGAQYGVKIEHMVAPSLKNVRFSNIESDRDIYLANTDVYLARGHWPSGLCNNEPQGQPFMISPADWSLTPGTDVVASNSSAIDGWYGDVGKVDLVAHAKFDALGAEGDSVKFGPETSALGTGDGWGGLILDYYAAGSHLKYVSIGQAPNPLFVFYADSTLTIRHSRIHHFADTGLWMDDTGPLGAVVDSCVIERGSGLDEQVGFTAVRLDQTDELRFGWNKLDLSELNVVGTSSTLDILWGSTHCAFPATGLDSLIVRNNWILGPGIETSVQGTRNGVKAYYLCGGTTRSILFDGNYIEKFNNAGMEIHQTKEAQMTCNTVLGVNRGLDFFRTSDITGQAVKFKQNWFEVKFGTNHAVRTDDNVKTSFGPAGSNLGDNGLLVRDANVKFIKELDPNAGDKLNARDGYWYLYHDTLPTPSEELVDDILDAAEITSRLDPSTDVLYNPFRMGSPFNYCRPSSPPGAGGSAEPIRIVSIPADSPERGPTVSAEVATLAPEVTYLRAHSTGKGAAAQVNFGIARANRGKVRIAIYDVAGRRLHVLVPGEDSEPGHYERTWLLQDSAGRRVAPGVYFVRLESPGLALTEKLVVLR